MMGGGTHPLAFIGPGGLEMFVVMLVLLMLFGAKDAPRIFRTITQFLDRIRNTAEGFRHEILYGDGTRNRTEEHTGEEEPGSMTRTEDHAESP